MSAESNHTLKKLKHTRCEKCDLLIWRSTGQTKVIRTTAEADQLSTILGKQVALGAELCNKCRGACYAGSSANKENSPVSCYVNSDSFSSDFSSQSSITSNSLDDPSFVVKELDQRPVPEYIELPFSRVVSTHKYCFVCGKDDGIITVPLEARRQAFVKRKMFIPKGNRCCPDHLIKKRFFEEILSQLRVYANTSSIDAEDLKQYLHYLSDCSESTILDKLGDYNVSEEHIKVFTGLTWENLKELRDMMTSMRSSKTRNVTQALVVFLYKMRTGNSNSLISATFGLHSEQQVSDYCSSVIESFEKDILPSHFGFGTISRQTLIEEESSVFAQELFSADKKLTLIFDGTYVTHQKSSNNEYQRKSYSGQKKKPLCKPFTICTTNGYIVETLGPFAANLNDAQIMRQIMEDDTGLKCLLQEGDICIVDRGFRDVKAELEDQGYTVCMPALKGKRKQLTTAESNASRLVTKVRWVVEAVHGIIGQKYKLLHHQLDNKLLPKTKAFCRIASFLNNKFGKRLNSDVDNREEILHQIASKKDVVNTLEAEVEKKGWSRKKVIFQSISSTDLADFPEMTEKDLKIFFTGTYQLKQAISYMAEFLDQDGNLQLQYLKDQSNIVKFQVRSRHINAKVYKCYIDYIPDSIGVGGVKRHYCECANGSRTLGCCSHIAAIVYYLSHARYLSKIVKPAEILSRLFVKESTIPVIEEDSDDD